jgi:hypothetical protein
MPSMDILPCSGARQCYRIGSFDRKRRRGTKDPTEPSSPEDGNVVPLFPEGLHEDLVPLAGADGEAALGHAGLGAARAGAWSEARSAQLLDPPDAVDSRGAVAQQGQFLPRSARVSIWAAGGAVIAAAAIALTSGSPQVRVKTSPHLATAGGSTTTSVTPTPGALAGSRSVSHAASRRPSHSQPRRHNEHHTRIGPANQTKVVAASYATTAPLTTATSSSSEGSAQYTPPVSRTPPPQQAAPEAPSASRASSASAAQNSAANRPAFGANGLLGPGSSPTS